jgi:hypothetical protein
MMTQTEFDALAQQYNDEAGICSFQHMMIKAPAFSKLVEGGMPIVPLILKSMEQDKIGGVMWFVVLETITGERPLKYEPLEHAGKEIRGWVGIKVEDTHKAWLNWGRQKGHLQ